MIRIYTFAHKRPDFVGLQYESFKRHLKEDFEMTVFNNAVFDRDQLNASLIDHTCHALGIENIYVEKDAELVEQCEALEGLPVFDGNGEYTNGNIACAYPFCWAWEKYGIHGINVCIIDSDMFLTQSTVLSDFLREQPLCYVPMRRSGGIEYMWNGILLMNMCVLPDTHNFNWWCGRIGDQSVDVGGQTHWWLAAHPEVRRKYIRSERIGDEGQKGHEILWLDDTPVLHYLRGSDFMHFTKEEIDRKTAWLKEQLK